MIPDSDKNGFLHKRIQMFRKNGSKLLLTPKTVIPYGKRYDGNLYITQVVHTATPLPPRQLIGIRICKKQPSTSYHDEIGFAKAFHITFGNNFMNMPIYPTFYRNVIVKQVSQCNRQKQVACISM